MALNNIQERIERSIFEKIRLLLVQENVIPDVSLYPETPQGQTQWETDLKTKIANNDYGWGVEIFNNSSADDKDTEKVPRIALITRRIIPGDVGTPGTLGFAKNPSDPDRIHRRKVDYQSVNVHIDINLVSNSADQNRFLHAIISKALGVKRHIEFFDSPGELFFMQQYNYYDLPNDVEGIDNRVYSYEVRDIFLYDELDVSSIALINKIEVEVGMAESDRAFYREDGIKIYKTIDTLVIDLAKPLGAP